VQQLIVAHGCFFKVSSAHSSQSVFTPLLIRTLTALETQQVEAATISGAAGEAKAAEVARTREEVGQALLVLSRPPTANGSRSYTSGASSASTGAANDGSASASAVTAAAAATVGVRTAAHSRPRAAQRQLAAKLASRLRAGGNGSATASAAGSSAAGSQAGDRGREGEGCGGGSDSDGEGGSDQQAKGMPVPRQQGSTWLSSGTREQLAKLTGGKSAGAAAAGGGLGGGDACKRTN